MVAQTWECARCHRRDCCRILRPRSLFSWRCSGGVRAPHSALHYRHADPGLAALALALSLGWTVSRGGRKALASMIGTGLFVTLLIGGLLTSCMLQSQIADGLSRAMMKAGERNSDAQERFSKQFEQDMDRAMRRWRD